jgi:hypothetical protein
VVLLSDAPIVTAAALGLSITSGPGPSPASESPDSLSWHKQMSEHLHAALVRTNWNISRTAVALDISRNTVRARIARFGLGRAPGSRAASPPSRSMPAARRAGARGPTASPIPATAPVAADTRTPPVTPVRMSVRSESREVGFLRVDLAIAPGSDGLSESTRTVDELLDKIRSFGGRIEELGQTAIIAAFGVEQPVEDGAIRAALAGLAAQRMTEQGRTDDRAPTVRCAVHVTTVPTRQVGETTFVDVADKQTALYALERLAPPAGAIAVSEEAAPLLRRRFSLIPMATTTLAAPRAYRIAGFESTRFRSGGRMAGFVGRTAELQLLTRHLELAMCGQGRIVGIVGEPGIGKSRLLYEFRQSLPPGEVTYLAGQCVSYGVGAPFLPILDLVRAACGIADTDALDLVADKVRRTLAALDLDADEWAPFLLHLLGGPADDRLAGPEPGGGERPDPGGAGPHERVGERAPAARDGRRGRALDRPRLRGVSGVLRRAPGRLPHPAAPDLSIGRATELDRRGPRDPDRAAAAHRDETAGIARSVFGAGVDEEAVRLVAPGREAIRCSRKS